MAKSKDDMTAERLSTELEVLKAARVAEGTAAATAAAAVGTPPPPSSPSQPSAPFTKGEGFRRVPSLVGSSGLKNIALSRGLDVACGCAFGLNSHNHTFFSVMDGIASPEDMVDISAKRGYGGIGISDHGTMGGVLRAGKAGKEWKTGRLKGSSKLFNYCEVSLDKQLKKYVFCDANWQELRGSQSIAYVLRGMPRAYVVHNEQNKKQFRLVGKQEREGHEWKVAPIEIDLKSYVKEFALCDGDWLAIDQDYIDFAFAHFPTCNVTFNTQNVKQFRVVEKADFEAFDSFKVLSGCELYVSWEREKEKKYHHITVYATGERGHRALVLLTSIGSIPSRRYIGARGFFRPRVFVEDIEVAVKESDGQLIVTTGCPISITSDALRNGNDAAAKEFFEWGVRTLPRGRFFAELHLCDVSLDFNGKYAKAEDRYYSSLFGVPISRFRHEELTVAREHATDFFEKMRLYVLGLSLSTYRMQHEGSARDAMQDSEFYINPDNPETLEFAKKTRTSGRSHPLEDLGITNDAFKIFSHDALELLKELRGEIDREVSGLIEAGMDEEEAQAEAAREAAIAAAEAEANANCKTEPGAAGASTAVGTTGISTLSTTKAESGKKKKGRKAATRIDEDSLVLVNLATKAIDRAERREFDVTDKPTSLAAATIGRFVNYVTAVIARDENLNFVNPHQVIQVMLGVPAKSTSLATEAAQKDAACLATLASDRALGLDRILAGEADREMVFGATRALVAFLMPESFGEGDALGPTAGDEDGLEKEWQVAAGGNWMEKVNAGLVKLAREFDVPLLMASDSHMTGPEMKPVQDAIIKRGKRRNWHMARPYAVPRGDILGYLKDAGADYTTEIDYIKSPGNCAYLMLEKGVLTLSDIVESFGSGSLILDEAKSCSDFKWATVVPKIRYSNHPYYIEAKDLLDSGGLRAFLPEETIPGTDIRFTEASVNISTSLIVVTFVKAVEAGLIPATEPYIDRLYSELYLQQEVPNEQLCDFFLVLQYVIDKWRMQGVSVGPGRGSSGGMLTAMICGITYADPIKKGFLESRWMNRGRKMKSAHADIDIDVSDRQIAGLELAKVARESYDDSVKEKPLTALEVILHAELFFSSNPVTHEWVGGVVREVEIKKKDLLAGFAENIGMARAPKDMSELARKREAGGARGEELEVDADNPDLIKIDDAGGNIVWGSPIFRVGTYGSLKAKAAVKEAIRICDETPFDKLPSFGTPTTAWLQENKDKIAGKTDEEKNLMHEEQFHSRLSLKERTARRRVKLADRITKEMTMGAGLARLYQSERDFFNGSVYAVVPDYWDAGARPPSGSDEAKRYFQANEKVEELILDMLNIYKSMGVHAGGLCFGREAFERVPVRADKHGYVAQMEMKDIEKVGVLKFDVLGLETLNHVSMTLRMMVKESTPEELSWWCPRTVYDRVTAGESTDIMWRHIPESTEEACLAMCRSRAMTFQIDTRVYAKELDKLPPEAVLALVRAVGDFRDVKNDKLTDIICALLALFRPGPMKFNSHIEYIERMMGKPWQTLHPWLEPFVRDTLGLIAYQEQVMAIVAAGMEIDVSNEKIDEIRRAMGKKDITALKKMNAEEGFKAGLSRQGVPSNIADKIWDLIIPFAEYGFNSPHSFHYAVISCVTLFLKSVYTKYFFRVVMGLAKPDDAARFLGEISNATRTPCIMRSKDLLWEVIDEQYFPGLFTIDNLKRKDIERILVVQETVRKSMQPGEALTAETWFKHMGLLSESLALTLSKSGALRILGTPDQIADGYASAIVNFIKPGLAKKKAAQKERDDADADSTEASTETSTRDIASGLGAGDSDGAGQSREAAPFDALADLIFEVRGVDAFDAKKKAKTDDDDDDDTDDDAEGNSRPRAGNSKTERKGAKKPAKAKEYKLGKKDQEIVDVLRSKGLAFAQSAEDKERGVEARSGVLTVESAMDMVLSNKTRGAGIRHLVAAMVRREEERAKKEVRRPRSFVMIKELEKLTREDGSRMAEDMIYRTIAIPSAVANTKNYKTGQAEPRITFLSEGTTLNAKFSRAMTSNLSAEEIDQITQTLKDEKMTTPFVIDIFAGQFRNPAGEKITYFKIENVEKVT